VAFKGDALHRKPNDLHRRVAQIWNEAAERPKLGLQSVHVPSFKRPPERVDWSTLCGSFQAEVKRYLAWCAGTDMFATRSTTIWAFKTKAPARVGCWPGLEPTSLRQASLAHTCQHRCRATTTFSLC
jgi:hypothetical protein